MSQIFNNSFEKERYSSDRSYNYSGWNDNTAGIALTKDVPAKVVYPDVTWLSIVSTGDIELQNNGGTIRIVYTGRFPKYFAMTVIFNGYKTGGGNDNVIFEPRLNEAPGIIKYQQKFETDNKWQTVSFTGIVPFLNTGDYLDFYVECTTANITLVGGVASFTFSQLN